MNFIKWTGLIAATAAGLAGGSAYAESFNVAHGYPPTHPVVAQGIVPWMACVEEKTGNAITFIHFPSGQITSHNAAIDSVNSGVTDIAAIITGYVSSQMPLNGIPLLPDMGTEPWIWSRHIAKPAMRVRRSRRNSRPTSFTRCFSTFNPPIRSCPRAHRRIRWPSSAA